MKIIRKSLWVIVILCILVIAKFVGKTAWMATESSLADNSMQVLEDKLHKIASDTNKRLPMMIDKDTSLDSTIYSSKKFVMKHTFVNYNSSQLDVSKIQRNLSSQIVTNICSEEKYKSFLELGITWDYKYYSNDGKYLTTIVVGKKECNY